MSSSHTNESVRTHYDSKRQFSTRERRDLQTIQLRSLNNWIKSVLINEYVHRGNCVLDLCSGKGGDLLKMARRSISFWIATDISKKSLEESIERYHSRKGPPIRFGAKFLAADSCQVSIAPALPTIVDVVSCQFAFHYSFHSEGFARMMLSNASCGLKETGYFFGTMADGNAIVRKMRAQRERNPSSLTISNPIYSITFDQFDRLEAFGTRYTFTLQDAIEACPEYLVHFPTLARLAEEYGFEVVKAQNFHQFFQENSKPEINQNGFDLLHKLKVFHEDGTFPDDDWEVAGLYMVFVFRKTKRPTVPLPYVNSQKVSSQYNQNIGPHDIVQLS